MSDNNEVTFNSVDTAPTLEQEAAAMGIDVNAIDHSAEEQSFNPTKPEIQKTETKEKILGKFNSQEEFENAYKELEKKLSQRK